MHHALRLEASILLVDLAEKLLDAHILRLLRASLNLSLVRLEVDFQHLVRHGEIMRLLCLTILLLLLLLSLLFCLNSRVVKCAVMVVWQCCFPDELKYLLEDVKQVLLFIIVQAQMHISKVSCK